MDILLIDDNEKLCILYQQLLARGGHNTRYISDPTRALDTIRESRPELILLDIMMEPLSGWDILELIRKDETISEIPVVILTGKVLTIQEALQYGLLIEGFVMKPVERTMLLSAIDEIKDVIDESEKRYVRAVSSGMTPEQAAECKNAIKKRNILQYLKENLTKQEFILKKDQETYSENSTGFEQLRTLIANEYQRIHELSEHCP